MEYVDTFDMIFDSALKVPDTVTHVSDIELLCR